MRRLHLLNAHVNCVEKSGPPLCICKHQTALNVFNRVREIGQKFRLFVEADHEKLVVRIRRLEELNHRLLALVDLVVHASAEIEDHAER